MQITRGSSPLFFLSPFLEPRNHRREQPENEEAVPDGIWLIAEIPFECRDFAVTGFPFVGWAGFIKPNVGIRMDQRELSCSRQKYRHLCPP